MKNKVFKYIKVFISMVLILSLVAPSYASLSASDGSAFVTKAEFDSALADFNSRLTTFEAGINSKIDSQVTSYLDRNGIWNGKDQAVNPAANFMIKLSTDPLGMASKIDPSDTTLWTAIRHVTSEQFWFLRWYDVCQTTKAGLCAFKFSISQAYSGYGNVSATANSGKGSDSVDLVIFNNFIDKTNPSGWYFSLTLGAVRKAVPLNPSWLDITLSWGSKEQTAYFFVVNGQNISWGVAYSANYMENAYYTGAGERTVVPEFKVDSVKVY